MIFLFLKYLRLSIDESKLLFDFCIVICFPFEYSYEATFQADV